MKKHICIFTQSPLTRAPRVVKEANTLAHAGFEITVYALWYDTDIVTKDRSLLHPSITYKAGVDLMQWNSLYSIVVRLKRKLARNLVKYFKIETVASLDYDFNNYLKKLKSENADIYIGHEEMSMALSRKLLKSGYYVGFDFEDWHSKDLLSQDRKYRPIRLLEQLESFLLKNAKFCYTTSASMANAMALRYNTEVPNVIYNAFSSEERRNMDGLIKDRQSKEKPSLYWFSQVISEGRGLELLFEALKYTNSTFELHLRGAISKDYEAKIRSLIPSHIALFIHDLVDPKELISRIAEHDIGLAFEEAIPESRNYTITNKIFHYLQSGIAILTTETAGQLEIAERVPNGTLIVERNAEKLAEAIDGLVNDCDKIEKMKEASWEAGATVFSYEKSTAVLQNIING